MDQENVKKLLKTLIKIVSHLGAIVATPLLILSWIPCKTHKTVVILTAKIFKWDFEPLKGAIDTILSDEEFFKNAGSCSIVTVLRLEGNLSLAQVTQIFQENVICCKMTNGRRLRYPQLKKYPVNYLGYPFWKKDKNFSLENHIGEYEPVSMLPVSKIHQKMLNYKYAKNRSPWQVLIFRSGQLNRTFLAIRIHHSISDGRSIVKLIVQCLGKRTLQATEPEFKTFSFSDKLSYRISLPFNLVGLLAKIFAYQFKIIGHPLKRKEFSNDCSPLFVGITGKISLAKLKNVARTANVHLSAIFMSVIIGALNKFLEIEGHEPRESVTLYFALPKKNHPETLKNHLYIGLPEVVYKDNDKERLLQCNKTFQYLRKSDHAFHMNTLIHLISLMPSPFRGILSSLRFITIGMSNIAGEHEGFLIGDYPCLGFTMSTGLLQGSLGVDFTVISYKETIQVSVVAKGSILTEKQTIVVARMVEREFVAVSKLVLDKK